MYIMELGLCSKHQELTIGGYFRQFWKDPRLAIDLGDEDEHTETMKFRDMFEDRKIWIPDSFIPGDKYGFLAQKDSAGARSFMKVQSCGGVLASMK